MFDLFKELLDFDNNGKLDLMEEAVGLTLFAAATEADNDDDDDWNENDLDDEDEDL